jgi:hypothetical protein
MDIRSIDDEPDADRSRPSPAGGRVVTVHAITDQPSRYRTEVMALTAADVVRSLGGLLFDRRCLGWDTLVLLDDCADLRPLQVIGADCADLKPALDMPERSHAAAIATSVQLYRNDPRVCARVNAAIDSGSTAVVLWGDIDSVGAKPQLVGGESDQSDGRQIQNPRARGGARRALD